MNTGASACLKKQSPTSSRRRMQSAEWDSSTEDLTAAPSNATTGSSRKKRKLEEAEAMDTSSDQQVNEVAVYSLQAPEPRNRAEFLKYSCQLILDPNTAYRKLCLSEGNRKVAWKGETRPYPDDHPERFDYWKQVLCREGLSGTRYYWEIEWRGGGVSIGVTYKGIGRKGWDGSCVLGFNDKSWSLFCSGSSYSAQHNNN